MEVNCPDFLHRWNHKYSILSVVTFSEKKLIFAGTQDSKILIFNLSTYNLVKVIQLGDLSEANTRSSVLCLTGSEDENYLFSAGADSLIRVWKVDIDDKDEFLKNDSSIKIWDLATVYSFTDIGDIFSISYLDNLDTLVFGCQDASLLFVDNIIKRIKNKTKPSEEKEWNKLPHRRYNKFFDSTGPSGSNLSSSVDTLIDKSSISILEVPSENIVKYAHNGFIYSISKLPKRFETLLENLYIPNKNHGTSINNFESIITGGGEGSNKVWTFYRDENRNIRLRLETIEFDNEESVLCQAIEYPFLYCGLTDGMIKIWDLSTHQLVSTLHTREKSDIISISVHKDHIFAINESEVTVFHDNNAFYWNPSQGKILASQIMQHKKGSKSQTIWHLLAGGNDGSLVLWNVDHFLNGSTNSNAYNIKTSNPREHIGRSNSWTHYQPASLNTEDMLDILKEFISFQTISQNNDTTQLMASRRCAMYLQQLFINMGADQSKLIPTADGTNPVVFAHFRGNKKTSGDKKKILWYGHYDVIPAGESKLWKTPPFDLTCEDGYMKGRGVSDNKGPLIAAIYSVASLYQQGILENDVVFLVEGNEEIGSNGLLEVCKENKDMIGEKIDWILLSNSTWIDKNHPCLNYGLRGVINATITVASNSSNKHSGLDGGMANEPTSDLIRIISQLSDNKNRVNIPNFYQSCEKISTIEEERIKRVLTVADFQKKATFEGLVLRWAKPSLSITTMNMSGPGNITVIPNSASIGISIRLVPGQNLEEIKENFIQYLEELFTKLDSPNKLKVDVVNEADAWLGDPENHAYQVLSEEIKNTWGTEPLFVREGGSIPCVRYLEKIFDTAAVQIPCGQSTDKCHLDNENLRIKNFTQMARILSNVINKL